MSYSTLLTLLLTTPAAKDLLPQLLSLAPSLLPHLEHLLHLIQDFREQLLTPAATRNFELQLQQCLRQLGLDLCDWTLNHLEADDPQQMPQRLDVQGERYRRRQRSPNTVATLFGPVTLHRYLYEDLEPGNPCLFPLEKRLGVVAGAATPALAERAAWWLAQRPQKATLELLARDHGVKWSAETLRNVTAAFAASLEEHRQEAQVEQVLAWLEKASHSRGRHRAVLVAGRDGIHLPIRASAYKEGATATLTVFDRRGRRLGTVYLGQMPQAGQGTLSQQLTELIEAVLRRWQGPLPRLGYVTDGGHHPVAYYRETLARMRHPRTQELLVWQRVVDFYHASVYVGQLAEALFGDTQEGRRWARRMRHRLKQKDGLKRVLQAATYYAGERKLKGSRRRDYGKAYRYLRRNGKWMKYWQYAQVGVPLGSGVTEAACKVVFTQRLKQSGMRWQRVSGQVVVTLRVVLLSRVWDKAVGRMLESQSFSWPGVQQLSAPEEAETAA
jgi:hypothetical protein